MSYSFEGICSGPGVHIRVEMSKENVLHSISQIR